MYGYDGNLKRVKSVIDGQTIYNVYDLSGALVHIETGDDPNTANKNETGETDYVSGPQGTLARIKNGIVTYLHPDHLGSAQAGTDASGAIIWREQYTPFGEELQSPAANDNLAGFTGHIKDKATGLNYMQARYYDPVIGRFLSIDPVTFMETGEPGFFNRYAYTFNDPVNLLDRTGKAPSTANAHTPPIVLNANAQRAIQNAASRPRLSLPVRTNSNGKAVITSKFGPRNIAVKGASKNHSGTDFRAPNGADILATQDGTIENIGQQSKAGDVVIVRNSDGSRSGHGHTGAAPGLKVGDSVQSGQVIGESNGSGTGAPHQHYTFTPANSTTKVDPMKTQLAPLANQTCNKGDSGCP